MYQKKNLEKTLIVIFFCDICFLGYFLLLSSLIGLKNIMYLGKIGLSSIPAVVSIFFYNFLGHFFNIKNNIFFSRLVTIALTKQ